GFGATLEKPNSLLSGDGNITNNLSPGYIPVSNTNVVTNCAWTPLLHHSKGHVLFSDNRVEYLDSKNLRMAIQNAGIVSNYWLTMPVHNGGRW
ncbi:MAG TPA: hypothetical protein VHH73_09940, partial [Verrucomicrobiae bacterium]|nr:hypothetical protein [Verrucomicrobiae bacterium]